MLTITLVAGLWISVLIVFLPQVLAHPHAVMPLKYQRPVRRRTGRR
jgi:hypothetical protein